MRSSRRDARVCGYSSQRCALEIRKLRRQSSDKVPGSRSDRIFLLSYRPGPEEAGPEKSFDLSPIALAQRWKAGMLDFEHASDSHAADEIIAVRRTGA